MVHWYKPQHIQICKAISLIVFVDFLLNIKDESGTNIWHVPCVYVCVCNFHSLRDKVELLKLDTENKNSEWKTDLTIK